MSQKLSDTIKYTRTGKITNPSSDSSSFLFNKVIKKMYLTKDLRVIKKDDQLYIKPFTLKDEEPTKEDLIENFIVLSEGKESNRMIDLNDIEDEKHVVSTDELRLDQNTHPFNVWLIRYLKENFNGRLVTNYRGELKKLLRLLINEPDKAITHIRVEKILEYIGSDYKLFLDWISNIKAVRKEEIIKIENKKENDNNERHE